MKRVLVSIVFMLAMSAAASAQSFTYYFPQIAVGGAWRTTIFISNATASGTATGTINVTKSDGTPWGINWIDEMGGNASNSGSIIAFSLGAGQTRKYTAVNDQPLSVGYATVSANASVLGTAMFTQLDGA